MNFLYYVIIKSKLVGGCEKMHEDTIVFKGTKDGLSIHLNNYTSFDVIKKNLLKKMSYGKKFFTGGTIKIILPDEILKESEKEELKSILFKQYEMSTIEIVHPVPILSTENMEIIEKQENNTVEREIFGDAQEGSSVFIQSTIRNGQRVNYKGNIIIIGDVNPGAEIIAGGNVAIMGSLRGMAHAGATGNENAVVAAFILHPTQLRIAAIITRPPEGNVSHPTYPEIARIRQNAIIIEPYLSLRGR
jgi:septum site-determining protein MinC